MNCVDTSAELFKLLNILGNNFRFRITDLFLINTAFKNIQTRGQNVHSDHLNKHAHKGQLLVRNVYGQPNWTWLKLSHKTSSIIVMW